MSLQLVGWLQAGGITSITVKGLFNSVQVVKQTVKVAACLKPGNLSMQRQHRAAQHAKPWRRHAAIPWHFSITVTYGRRTISMRMVSNPQMPGRLHATSILTYNSAVLLQKSLVAVPGKASHAALVWLAMDMQAAAQHFHNLLGTLCSAW